MKVEYKVDAWGYNPTITFEGEANIPEVPAPTDVGGGAVIVPGTIAPAPAPAPQQPYPPPNPQPSYGQPPRGR